LVVSIVYGYSSSLVEYVDSSSIGSYPEATGLVHTDAGGYFTVQAVVGGWKRRIFISAEE
jgi:hypothetical protein